MPSVPSVRLSMRHSMLAVAAAAAFTLPSAFLTPPATAVASAAAPHAAAVPAAAASTSSAFDVTYGATYTRGTLVWKDRAVDVSGTQRAVNSSGCRRTHVTTYNARGALLGSKSSSQVCGRSAPFSFRVPANVRGGAAKVKVCLVRGASTNLKCTTYRRP